MAAIVWNGSFLGEFSKDAIQFKEIRGKDRYWTLNLGTPITCRVKQIPSSFPTLIDELKPVFGLPKLGTHQIRIESKNYLLIKCPEPGVTEVPLNQFIPGSSQYILFRRQIQELLAFRDVLAVSSTYESSLRVRLQPRRPPVPMSYREPKMAFDASRSIISSRLHRRWFSDITIDQTLARMIHLDPEDVSAGIAEFRSQLEATISRIDRSLIWCSAFIMERLMARLLGDLGPAAIAAIPKTIPSNESSHESTESTESPNSVESPESG